MTTMRFWSARKPSWLSTNLASAMVDPIDPVNVDKNPDSKIPPVYTYWAQFIDHELTARTDRDENVSDIRLDVAGPETG